MEEPHRTCPPPQHTEVGEHLREFLGFPAVTTPPIRRALRKALTHLELRRAARRPNLPLKVKPGLPPLRPGGALPPPAAAPHPASTSEPIVLED